jgi:hypothetical protein
VFVIVGTLTERRRRVRRSSQKIMTPCRALARDAPTLQPRRERLHLGLEQDHGESGRSLHRPRGYGRSRVVVDAPPPAWAGATSGTPTIRLATGTLTSSLIIAAF